MSVHLSVTSSFTLMKSTIRIPQLIQALKERGYDTCALCDHNVLYGAASFLRACRENGIKPIIGMEVDVEYHDEIIPFVLLSKDNRGYQNLLELSSVRNDPCTESGTRQGSGLYIYPAIGGKNR